MAGERGYIPLTLGLGAPYLASQWEVMEEGAAEAGRPPPSRSDWRIVRDVWIAETDAEARKQAREGMLWRAWEQYLYPFWSSGPQPIVKSMKHDESVADDDVTLDYIFNHSWLVGSPDTVAAKIRELYEFSGGFGVFLAMVLDHSDDPEGFRRSLTLLQTEVMPQLADLSI
jgi:alkanesulfonate monooxygenase SsuD/methylene tetrahydromethanopterin reductase-like flavin-dependent oxidoreductase (luciferase family)